eukprot:4189310-Pyramimonas_sp.AAC.1
MIGPQQLIGNTIADLDAKRGAQSHQHEAYRATYEFLEFAAHVGVLGHGREVTSEGPEPSGAQGSPALAPTP